VARARAAPRLWRELPFTLAIEGGVLDGSVDLVFEESGKLVLVDYKTDAVPPSAVDARMKTHRRQISEYALALGELGGLPVREAVVLFLSAGESRTLHVTPALLAEVRAALGRPSPQGALF
jgi:ATP-dependent exoDNAse (exonuclease V) beta subunit